MTDAGQWGKGCPPVYTPPMSTNTLTAYLITYHSRQRQSHRRADEIWRSNAIHGCPIGSHMIYFVTHGMHTRDDRFDIISTHG